MMLLSRWPGNSAGAVLERWFTSLVAAVNGSASLVQYGSGSPEGVVTAPQGYLFLRSDGAGATTVYAKTSGGVTTPTNTGWTAIS